MARPENSDEERFLRVRESILARRNPEKLAREARDLAAMTDNELDELERLVTPWPLTTSRPRRLDQIHSIYMSIRQYGIGLLCATISGIFVLSMPRDSCVHRSTLILAVVVSASVGGLRAGLTASTVSSLIMMTFLAATEYGRIIWTAMIFLIPAVIVSTPQKN